MRDECLGLQGEVGSGVAGWATRSSGCHKEDFGSEGVVEEGKGEIEGSRSRATTVTVGRENVAFP